MRQKERAMVLRKKFKKSYNEIAKELNVAKSTLSEWFKNDKESALIKKQLSDKTSERVARRIAAMVAGNQIRWEAWREAARVEARKEFMLLKKQRLFVAGVMLYWGEGDSKQGNPFRFTNTNAKMMALFVRFLIAILKVPRENLRVTMILYPDLYEEECKKYWSTSIKVPREQFYKTQYIKGRSHPTKRLAHGICMIMCGGRQLKEKMFVWIDLLSSFL